MPLDDVVAQVEDKLSTAPDYITLSGSGEPTLYSRLGALIASIKRITKIPVAVVTNGSLLWDKDVQEGLADADLVIPSLDAGDEMLFRHINRPHEAISFERMVEGLVGFRSRFDGAYWLEVFLLGGMSAIPAEVDKIGGLIERIRPDRVQLNTATRPPAEDFALPVSRRDMERFARMLGGRAEVIARADGDHRRFSKCASQQRIRRKARGRPGPSAPTSLYRGGYRLGPRHSQERSGQVCHRTAGPRCNSRKDARLPHLLQGFVKPDAPACLKSSISASA